MLPGLFVLESLTLFDFLVGERLAPLEACWTLERDSGFVPPHTLQIGVTPGRLRLLPRRSGGARLRVCGALLCSDRRDSGANDRGERKRHDGMTSVHVTAPPPTCSSVRSLDRRRRDGRTSTPRRTRRICTREASCPIRAAGTAACGSS